MGLFGSSKKSYLGIDLGSGGIKVVELQNEKGRARLVTYGFNERTPDEQPTNPIDSPKETAELLRKIVKAARGTVLKAVGGLPIASVFSSVISVPKGPDKEMKEAIQWQAKKLIPVPLEEMVLDSKIISGPKDKKSGDKPAGPAASKEGEKGDKKKEQKTVQVLITGAAKSMVQKYVAVFKTAGLELVSLETETFALIRSLIGKDKTTSMLVDIGSVRTNIVIVENGIPYVTRSLDMGGVELTKAMAKALSLELSAAEKMKCDIKSVSSLYPGEGLPKIFEHTLAPMLTELQYSMNLYAGQDDENQGKRIEKVILTGGSAALPALAGHVSERLNVRAYVGDPWARVVYPDGLRPVLEEIGPRYAVAVGLAMRDIE
ncbi:hypothetical protein AMJ57_02915 [Parcubacteria bacterium SG8_24]|nr:MAG: hypothetical protein AMJ57_02915 [Parcubacteria bacterium SG8_24]